MSKVETEVHRLMTLHEKIQTDLQRIANGLAIMNERMDRGFASVHRRFEEIAEELRVFVREQA